MTSGIGISPEFLALIQQAARETIHISLATKALAIQLRQRIHSARKQLFRAASKPNATEQDRMLSTLAESIETSITHDTESGLVILIVRPRDSQFREALRAAGVVIDQSITEPNPNPNPNPNPGPEPKPKPTSAFDPMQAYLGRKE